MKNFKNYIVPALIFVFLVYRLPILSFRTCFQLLALYGTISFFCVYLISKNHPYPALFLILCAVHSYIPIATVASLHALRVTLIGVFCYFILVELKLKKDSVYNALCVSCLFHVGFIILQYFGVEPYLLYGLITTSESNIGLTANINEGSAMIALLTPCFFRKTWIYFLPLLLIGLVLSGASGGMFAFCLVIFFYLAIYRKMRLLSIITVTIVGVLFYNYIDRPDFSNRLPVWVEAIKLSVSGEPISIKNMVLHKSTVIGFGIGHWGEISKYCLNHAYVYYFERAHNTFIHCFFELGPGFILILVFYSARLVKQARNNMIFVLSLISIFIVCNVNSAFRINYLNGMIMTIWLALIESNWRRHVSRVSKLQGNWKGAFFKRA